MAKDFKNGKILTYSDFNDLYYQRARTLTPDLILQARIEDPVDVDLRNVASVQAVTEATNYSLLVQSSQSPNTTYNIGFLYVNDVNLGNRDIGWAKANIAVIYDTCPGYNFRVYNKNQIDLHVKYLLTQVQSNSDNNPTIIVELNPETIKENLHDDGRFDQAFIQETVSSVIDALGRDPDFLLEALSPDAFGIDQIEEVIFEDDIEPTEETAPTIEETTPAEAQQTEQTAELSDVEKELEKIRARVANMSAKEIKKLTKKIQEKGLIASLKQRGITPTQNFLNVYKSIEGLYESVTYKIKKGMLPNELGLVVFGPPGVGKTFAVQYAKEALSDKCAHVTISGDSTNINALSDAFYGYGILNTDEHGTKSDFVFGGIVDALSDAVKNNKDAVNVVINEFNRSASMGKLDQILRDTGDTQTITIETMGDVNALRLKLKEQYGIEARAVGSSLVIDLNNVDGNGKKVAVFYTLIGNPGNERINAAQYGVAPIPAALSRRLRAIYVDYLDPQIDQKEIMSIFENASSTKYLADNYERELRFLIPNDEKKVIASTKDFKDLLVESMASIYIFFYNLYTNGKVDIVPAPTEIAEQFEYMIDLVRETVGITDPVEQAQKVAEAFYSKLVDIEAITFSSEDSKKSFIDELKNILNEVALQFDVVHKEYFLVRELVQQAGIPIDTVDIASEMER
ncbi:MAG TPA: hypothetical protein PKV93_10580 [Fervidobacterium sp.]|nr:hypothetical protein [Fervidobacterium sp.]